MYCLASDCQEVAADFVTNPLKHGKHDGQDPADQETVVEASVAIFEDVSGEFPTHFKTVSDLVELILSYAADCRGAALAIASVNHHWRELILYSRYPKDRIQDGVLAMSFEEKRQDYLKLQEASEEAMAFEKRFFVSSEETKRLSEEEGKRNGPLAGFPLYDWNMWVYSVWIILLVLGALGFGLTTLVYTLNPNMGKDLLTDGFCSTILIGVTIYSCSVFGPSLCFISRAICSDSRTPSRTFGLLFFFASCVIWSLAWSIVLPITAQLLQAAENRTLLGISSGKEKLTQGWEIQFPPTLPASTEPATLKQVKSLRIGDLENWIPVTFIVLPPTPTLARPTSLVCRVSSPSSDEEAERTDYRLVHRSVLLSLHPFRSSRPSENTTPGGGGLEEEHHHCFHLSAQSPNNAVAKVVSIALPQVAPSPTSNNDLYASDLPHPQAPSLLCSYKKLRAKLVSPSHHGFRTKPVSKKSLLSLVGDFHFSKTTSVSSSLVHNEVNGNKYGNQSGSSDGAVPSGPSSIPEDSEEFVERTNFLTFVPVFAFPSYTERVEFFAAVHTNFIFAALCVIVGLALVVLIFTFYFIRPTILAGCPRLKFWCAKEVAIPKTRWGKGRKLVYWLELNAALFRQTVVETSSTEIDEIDHAPCGGEMRQRTSAWIFLNKADNVF